MLENRGLVGGFLVIEGVCKTALFGQKCHLYFPLTSEDPIITESFKIKLKTQVFQNSLFRISALEIHCLKSESLVHSVTHYHIDNWEDLSVVSQSDQTHFMDLVKTLYKSLKSRPEEPALFHCSAGVGRTGTFLTIFYLYQEHMERKNTPQKSLLSVHETLLTLRKQRAQLVETEEQYLFIYNFLRLFEA